jgi:hypothetical protein
MADGLCYGPAPVRGVLINRQEGGWILMVAKYWQAALLAASMVLAANPARAEDPPVKDGCGACCKDNKCCTSKECCKGKCGVSCGCCCAAKTEQVKKTAFTHPIIVMVPIPVMPAPVCGMIAHPIAPPAPQYYSAVAPAPIAPPMPPRAVTTPVPPPPPPPCGPYSCPMSCPAAPTADFDTGLRRLVIFPAASGCPAASTTDADTGIDSSSWLSLLGMAADLCCSHAQPPSLPSMCISALGLAADLCSQTWSGGMTLPSPTYVQHPPQYIPPSPPFPMPRELTTQEACAASALLPPPIPAVTCSTTSAEATAVCTMKPRIVAKACEGQIEMSVGEDACMSCKKTVVKVGDYELTLTTVDGQVRVRAPELKAMADCVCADRKGHLILEGDAVLHYRKDGQRANLKAERIEIDLSSGSVTIKPAAQSSY